MTIIKIKPAKRIGRPTLGLKRTHAIPREIKNKGIPRIRAPRKIYPLTVEPIHPPIIGI